MNNGDVACQGIGGDYKATLAANFQDKGTDDKAIAEAMKVINQAMTACPQSTMILAGYRSVKNALWYAHLTAVTARDLPSSRRQCKP